MARNESSIRVLGMVETPHVFFVVFVASSNRQPHFSFCLFVFCLFVCLFFCFVFCLFFCFVLFLFLFLFLFFFVFFLFFCFVFLFVFFFSFFFFLPRTSMLNLFAISMVGKEISSQIFAKNS